MKARRGPLGFSVGAARVSPTNSMNLLPEQGRSHEESGSPSAGLRKLSSS